jgi:hypothetical protein
MFDEGQLQFNGIVLVVTGRGLNDKGKFGVKLFSELLINLQVTQGRSPRSFDHDVALAGGVEMSSE